MNSLPSLQQYQRHLEITGEWLLRSVVKGNGGSCATYTPVIGWSAPYPETTGYLIPTLLDLHSQLSNLSYGQAALHVGEWLLRIQHNDGSWPRGLYYIGRLGQPSIFNTGQIIKGMVRLYDHTQDKQWLDAAQRAADWLADGVNDDGQWLGKDYRSTITPSYYAQVAWPMLEVWQRTGDRSIRAAAERVFDLVLRRQQPNGAFANWGFAEGAPAFTHTIAYTLRGLLEAARLTGDWKRYGEPTTHALEKLRTKTELTYGYLPGAFDLNWSPTMKGTCLTGNAQLAICLLVWEEQVKDLRLVNAAAKLVDEVCRHQWEYSWPKSLCGAVPGSWPIWGQYMTMRYPNWAAKYLCDALIRLMNHLYQEVNR